MRCRDARQWLYAQRDNDSESAEVEGLQEHLAQCPVCRAYQQQISRVDTLFDPSAAPMHSSVSTDRIMLAIQRQQRITKQLEDIRQQQQTRVARLRGVGAVCAAITFLTLSSIPLLLLAVAIIQTDLVVKVLTALNGVIDVVIILGEYLQTGVTLVSRDNWLLSGIAFAVVVMMGMWLRLMRHPQEA